MEAATLKSKKQIKKGQLKKTIKNVICRPDPVFWPQTSDVEGTILEEELNKYKVEIPKFRKPLWSELSQIPKNLRPKPPPIPKVEDLIFGLIECQKLIDSKECVGVLIEAAVNPKTIVQPLLESCTKMSIPVLCLKELRRITKTNFGIPTSALGVKRNSLHNLENKLLDISKSHRPSKQQSLANNVQKEVCNPDEKAVSMEVDNIAPVCPYLYRTDNKTRVFTPTNENAPKVTNKFIGQDFIELSKSSTIGKLDSKQFMKMIVKKIANNPNRKKVTKKGE